MKILQIHCTYQYQGGEDSVVINERNLLRSAGAVVDELVFTNEGQALQKLVQAGFNFGAYKKTREKIKSFAPDIVHIHNLHFAASPSVIYAISKSGTPYVQTLHNYRLLCPSGILYHNGNIFLKSLQQRFPWTAIGSGVYRNSKMLTAWLALSTKMHQWLRTWKKAGKYIVLTRHAQDLFLSSRAGFEQHQFAIKPNFSFSKETFAGPAPADHFVFVGRLTEEKGIRVLLKAFSLLPHRIKIAGDGPLRDQVIACSEKCPNIEYVGVLAKEAVIPFLSGAAALVFPSIWYEGMPMVVIEAFASGLPVIASKLGATEEMIADRYNGLHFQAGNDQDLTRAVLQYDALPSPEKKRYSENAHRSFIDHYSPDKNADMLLNIYRDVIEAHSRVAARSPQTSYTPV